MCYGGAMHKHYQEPIEQILFTLLQKGTMTIPELIEAIERTRPQTTKQGVYRVLRKLKNEEKIVIHGKSVSLNLHWIKNMSEFFSLAQYYSSPKLAADGSFLGIQEKDKVVYFFKNLKLLDAFWSHAFHMFNAVLPADKPILVYNPHEWFAYARPETEQTLLRAMKEKNRQVLVVVTHNESLDQKLKTRFSSDTLQYHSMDKKIFDKENYYLNIFGDFLIEVSIDQNIAQHIDTFFKKTQKFTNAAKEELMQIVSQAGRNKLTISRNKKKATKYKKMMSKYFFIKTNTHTL